MVLERAKTKNKTIISYVKTLQCDPWRLCLCVSVYVFICILVISETYKRGDGTEYVFFCKETQEYKKKTNKVK